MHVCSAPLQTPLRSVPLPDATGLHDVALDESASRTEVRGGARLPARQGREPFPCRASIAPTCPQQHPRCAHAPTQAAALTLSPVCTETARHGNQPGATLSALLADGHRVVRGLRCAPIASRSCATGVKDPNILRRKHSVSTPQRPWGGVRDTRAVAVCGAVGCISGCCWSPGIFAPSLRSF